MEKNSEEYAAGNMTLQNASNILIILTNETQGNRTEYDMPLETIVRGSIACLGTASNTLVILVSARLLIRSSRSHTILILLLAIADILYLLSIMALDIVDFDTTLLKCRDFIKMFSAFSSSWLIVLISCERFICVQWPIKMHVNHNNCKKLYAVVLAIMFVLLAGISSIDLIMYYVENRSYNKGIYDRQKIFIELISISLYGIIPMIPVLIFNFSILRSLVKHKRPIKDCLDEDRANNKRSLSKMDTSVTITVLSVSLMFVLGRFPFSIIYMIHIILKIVANGYILYNRSTIHLILLTMDLLDHTLNPVLYIFSSSVFRTELFNMIRCRKTSFVL